MAEFDVGVGKLSTEKAIHSTVVARDLQVADAHLQGVVLGSINNFKSLLRCQQDVNHNILLLMSLQALINS